MKLLFNLRNRIQVGQQTVIYSKKPVPVGEPVTFFGVLGSHVGNKPIADGVVVAALKDDPTAPITPTKTGKPKANAWRNLYRIQVTQIKE